MSSMAIILSIIQNIALLITIVLANQIVTRRWNQNRLVLQILSGCLFGCACVIGMMTPVRIIPGIIFDGRSIILSVVGLFFGPLVAFISALIAAFYRIFHVGGAGVWMGTGVIFSSALIGVLFYYWRKKNEWITNSLSLLGFGVLVHVVMLCWMVALPSVARPDVFQKMVVSILLVYPIATMLVCRLFLDSEEQIRAEAALSESEKKYRELIENVNNIVLRMDPQGQIKFLNEYGLHFFGFEKEEILGRNVIGTILPEKESSGRDLSRMILDLGRNPDGSRFIENQYIRSNGERVWISWTNKPVLDESGSVKEILCVGTDISTRKSAEEALKNRESLLSAIIDNIPCEFWARDMDECCFMENSKLVEHWGSQVGKRPEDSQVTSEELQIWKHNNQRAFQGEVVDEVVEYEVNGKKQFYQNIIAPILMDNEIKGILGLNVDITEYKKVQAELEYIYDHVPCLLWSADVELVDGKPLWKNISAHNDAAAQRYLPIHQIPGTNYFCSLIENRQQFPNQEQELDRISENALLSGQKNYSQYFRVTRIDGQIRWLYEDAFIEKVAQDRWQVIGICSDVTERRNAEEALRESEAKYRLLVEHSSDLIWNMTPDTVLKYLSPSWERVTGHKPENLLGQTVDLILHPDDVNACREFVRSVVQSRQSKQSPEYRIKHADGSWHWHVGSCAPVFDSKGLFVSVVGVSRDITEQIQSRERQKTMAEMLDVAPCAILIHDFDGKILYVNRKASEIHGYSEQQFLALNLHQLDVPESDKYIADRLEIIRNQGEASFEVEHFRSDGTRIPLDVFVKIVEWEGRPALLSVSTDLTERKKSLEERMKLHEQFLQSQKLESVGRLAGGVAHDFNNMLGVILGHVEMALEEIEPSEELYTDLLEIQKAAERSADLTRQLLAYARKQTVSPRILDINECIEGMLKMLRRLMGEDMELVWLPAREKCHVKMDPSQINQILANLCVNARDAVSGPGKVTITTEKVEFDDSDCASHPDLKPGTYVMFTVSDNGPGIDQSVLSHIFEPFFTTKGVGEGTGLGLATVYGIVKQNNGFILVYSELDKGTTFKIFLPFFADELPLEKTPVVDIPKGNGQKILIVEDEIAIMNMGKTMLERLGYRVWAASTAAEAINIVRGLEGGIDLLVTDVIMPDMNGRELASIIRSCCPKVRTLFMSGYTADVIAHRGVLDEGVDFLQKPFSLKTIAQTTHEILQRV